MDDNKIIELFFNRSEEAIVELSEKYGHICKRIAKNILKNNSDAEECVNDTYLGVWNTIPPQKPNPLLTYVCRIARNLAIKKYHYNTAKKRNSYYDAVLDELYACIPAPISTDEQIQAKELSQMLNAFLETLEETNRVMFVRRYWFSDSISDIAELVQMNPHNVTVRLARTREKLKQYLILEGVEL